MIDRKSSSSVQFVAQNQGCQMTSFFPKWFCFEAKQDKKFWACLAPLSGGRGELSINALSPNETTVSFLTTSNQASAADYGKKVQYCTQINDTTSVVLNHVSVDEWNAYDERRSFWTNLKRRVGFGLLSKVWFGFCKGWEDYSEK